MLISVSIVAYHCITRFLVEKDLLAERSDNAHSTKYIGKSKEVKILNTSPLIQYYESQTEQIQRKHERMLSETKTQAISPLFHHKNVFKKRRWRDSCKHGLECDGEHNRKSMVIKVTMNR